MRLTAGIIGGAVMTAAVVFSSPGTALAGQQNPAVTAAATMSDVSPGLTILDPILKTMFPGLTCKAVSMGGNTITLEDVSYLVKYASESSESSWIIRADAIAIDLDFTGLFFKPGLTRITGNKIELTGGRLKTPVVLKQVVLSKVKSPDPQNDVLEIDPVTAMFGGSTVEVSGTVPFPSLTQTVHSRLSGLNVSVAFKSECSDLQSLIAMTSNISATYRGGVKAAVAISAFESGISVSGTCLLENGKIIIPVLKKSQVPVPSDYIRKVDFTIEAGHNVNLITDKMNTTLTGEMKVMGSGYSGLELSGDLDVIAGHLTLKGSRLEVQEGTISISSMYGLTSFGQLNYREHEEFSTGLETAKQNNYVNVQYKLKVLNSISTEEQYVADIQGNQGGYFIGLTCSRLYSPDNLPFRLYLNEPVDGEIMGAITSPGTTFESEDRQRKSHFLQNLFIGSLLNSAKRTLERLFDVDTVHFSMKLTRMNDLYIPRFDISKSITRNVSLSYCRDFEESKTSLGVTYKPGSRILLRSMAEFDETDTVGISVGISVGFNF